MCQQLVARTHRDASGQEPFGVDALQTRFIYQADRYVPSDQPATFHYPSTARGPETAFTVNARVTRAPAELLVPIKRDKTFSTPFKLDLEASYATDASVQLQAFVYTEAVDLIRGPEYMASWTADRMLAGVPDGDGHNGRAPSLERPEGLELDCAISSLFFQDMPGTGRQVLRMSGNVEFNRLKFKRPTDMKPHMFIFGIKAIISRAGGVDIAPVTVIPLLLLYHPPTISICHTTKQFVNAIRALFPGSCPPSKAVQDANKLKGLTHSFLDNNPAPQNPVHQPLLRHQGFPHLWATVRNHLPHMERGQSPARATLPNMVQRRSQLSRSCARVAPVTPGRLQNPHNAQFPAPLPHVRDYHVAGSQVGPYKLRLPEGQRGSAAALPPNPQVLPAAPPCFDAHSADPPASGTALDPQQAGTSVLWTGRFASPVQLLRRPSEASQVGGVPGSVLMHSVQQAGHVQHGIADVDMEGFEANAGLLGMADACLGCGAEGSGEVYAARSSWDVAGSDAAMVEGSADGLATNDHVDDFVRMQAASASGRAPNPGRSMEDIGEPAVPHPGWLEKWQRSSSRNKRHVNIGVSAAGAQGPLPTTTGADDPDNGCNAVFSKPKPPCDGLYEHAPEDGQEMNLFLDGLISDPFGTMDAPPHPEDPLVHIERYGHGMRSEDPATPQARNHQSPLLETTGGRAVHAGFQATPDPSAPLRMDVDFRASQSLLFHPPQKNLCSGRRPHHPDAPALVHAGVHKPRGHRLGNRNDGTRTPRRMSATGELFQRTRSPRGSGVDIARSYSAVNPFMDNDFHLPIAQQNPLGLHVTSACGNSSVPFCSTAAVGTEAHACAVHTYLPPTFERVSSDASPQLQHLSQRCPPAPVTAQGCGALHAPSVPSSGPLLEGLPTEDLFAFSLPGADSVDPLTLDQCSSKESGDEMAFSHTCTETGPTAYANTAPKHRDVADALDTSSGQMAEVGHAFDPVFDPGSELSSSLPPAGAASEIGQIGGADSGLLDTNGYHLGNPDMEDWFAMEGVVDYLELQMGVIN